MIRVMVPSASSSKERGESVSEWVTAEPHVNSEYPIWPDDIIDLSHGVHVGRDKDMWGRIPNEDEIVIETHGSTQVFINGKQITGMGSGEILDIAEGIGVRRHVGRTYLRMGGESKSCELTVETGGKNIARVRLERVIGAEADRVRENENMVEELAWGHLREGTSDFSRPRF